MKCIVDKCQNHDHQGNGMYFTDRFSGKNWKEIWICMPCWGAIRGMNTYPQFTQIYRNMKRAWQTQDVLEVEEYYKED